MSQLVFAAPDISLYSRYYVNANREVTTHANIVTEEIHFTVEGIPVGAQIIRSVLYVTMDGYGAGGSNLKICRIDGTDVRCDIDGSGPVPRENTVRMNVRSNREVVAVATYQTNEITFTEGWHGFSAHFKDIRLVIDYLEESAVLPPTEDDYAVLPPVKTVVYFDRAATNYDSGGVVLHPISSGVSEECNGEWELQMELPMDEQGRWKMVTEGSQIKAPIPPTIIPEMEMESGVVWRVKTSVTKTNLYSKLPTYIPAKNKASKIASKWTDYLWRSGTQYNIGDKVVYDSSIRNIYECIQPNIESAPFGHPEYWHYLATLGGHSSQPQSGGTYDPGKVIEELDGGSLIVFIADYNSVYMRVRSQRGNIGYIHREDCEETEDFAPGGTEPKRILYTQIFRVYEVSGDEADGKVSISAHHISYDLRHNMLFDCKAVEADPPTAIAQIHGGMINDDGQRKIVCNITDETINADWSFKNPIQAILDPDEGLAAKLDAKVMRDNRDFFILSNVKKRRGPRLSYGTNLIGVSWTRNDDDLVTRIIPRAKDKEGNYLFLDELYIDSPHIAEYPMIRTEILDSQYSVGQKITRADGKEITLDTNAVIERMRQEAENRFYRDGADAVTVSLEVNFVLLGDTEQYKQYRNLQRLNLFDYVEIDTGSTTVAAQVTGYEWDCLSGMYKSIRIGKVYSQIRSRVPGYRLANGAVTYDKLAPALYNKIKGDD